MSANKEREAVLNNRHKGNPAVIFRQFIKNREVQAVENEKLIEDILRHLDEETQMGVMRMSVEMDEKKSGGGEVSHKCCNMYGRPANETVGLLDCYTDMNAGRPDNER